MQYITPLNESDADFRFKISLKLLGSYFESACVYTRLHFPIARS